MIAERKRPRPQTGGSDATGKSSSGSILTCDVRDCRICGETHDEVISLLWEPIIRRIEDADLTAELIYVQRELLDDPDEEWRASLMHRLALIKGEISRRRRIAGRGGPVFKAQTSISRERIAAVKQVDIADVIGRDLPIAWMRRNRTVFYCDAHGDHHDRKPSLVSYDDQRRWHCFGCNQGGTAIDWMIVRHGLEFRQAVEELERWAA